MSRSQSTPSRLRERRRLSTVDIAGMLDEPLYDPRLDLDEVMAGCRRAADAGMAAVVPASRVALAAHALAGTGVRVSAAPALDLAPEASNRAIEALRASERVLQDGATELGLLATPGQLESSARAAFAALIHDVVRVAGELAAVVKVILPVSGVCWAAVLEGCRVSVDSGATMVQGGTWLGNDRASLTQIARMRAALGEEVLLKWTAPIGNLDRLLIACAEGADRFNADTTAVLRQAAERARLTELRIPELSADY